MEIYISIYYRIQISSFTYPYVYLACMLSINMCCSVILTAFGAKYFDQILLESYYNHSIINISKAFVC